MFLLSLIIVMLCVFVLNFQSEEKVLKKVRRKIKNKVCEFLHLAVV